MNDLATYEGLAAVSSMQARVEAVEWKDVIIEIASAPKSQRVRLMTQIAERTGRGDLTDRYPDRNNHTIDATRYALENDILYGDAPRQF